jgi:hypothetical protein
MEVVLAPAFAVGSTHQPHSGVVGYTARYPCFPLHKEGLFSSSGDMNNRPKMIESIL